MLSRFIYDYIYFLEKSNSKILVMVLKKHIYKNKYLTIIYMGYKQKLRERRKKILQEESKKKILSEWVLIDANVVNSVARPRPLS